MGNRLARLWSPASSAGAAALAEQVAQAAHARHAAEAAQQFLHLAGIDLDTFTEAAAPLEAARGAVGSAAGTREPELIVLRAFVLVAENVVGFLHFLETRFRLLVAGIA